MQFNVHEAKTQSPKLIEAALRGEEVVIARDSKPAVRLVPVEARKPFVLGLLEGLGGEIPDFEPIANDGLDRWEREGDERLAAASSQSRE